MKLEAFYLTGTERCGRRKTVGVDTMIIPLIIPRAYDDERNAVIEAFRAEGVAAKITGLYATKAAGPTPDANFWIDLTRHAETFPLEHFVEQLEGALGLALLSGFHRIAKWASKKVRIHLRLPSSKHSTHYIIPDEPDDKAAVKAIARHYKTATKNLANEYFWVSGEWVSAEEYFKAKGR